jgi:hypothetical protein
MSKCSAISLREQRAFWCDDVLFVEYNLLSAGSLNKQSAGRHAKIERLICTFDGIGGVTTCYPSAHIWYKSDFRTLLLDEILHFAWFSHTQDLNCYNLVIAGSLNKQSAGRHYLVCGNHYIVNAGFYLDISVEVQQLHKGKTTISNIC